MIEAKIYPPSQEWKREEAKLAVGKWRIHNGEDFVRRFDTKEEAVKAAEQLNALCIGYCNWDKETQDVYYTQVEGEIK